MCPKKGINPAILLWGWDWAHQNYSREGYGYLGLVDFYGKCRETYQSRGCVMGDGILYCDRTSNHSWIGHESLLVLGMVFRRLGLQQDVT